MVGFREPFQRLFHQGWVRQGGTKMSKSKGNVTAPDQLADLYGADAVRLYILFVGPADQDMDWTEEGSRASPASCAGCGGSWTRPRRAGRIGRRRGAAGAEGARDDREGERRHRPALRLQHADRGGDGAGQRARARPVGAGRALRRRDRGLADPAVRAAHRRGAVVGAGARAPVGAAVAGRRRVAAASARRSSWCCRSTAACATGSRRRPGSPRSSWSSGRRPRRRCRRTWTARRSGRRSSSREARQPGRLDRHAFARRRHTRVTLARARSTHAGVPSPAAAAPPGRCRLARTDPAPGRFVLGAGTTTMAAPLPLPPAAGAGVTGLPSSRGWCTSSEPCAGRACTGSRTARGSRTPSPARAEPRPRPISRRSISPRRWPTASRSSCLGAAPARPRRNGLRFRGRPRCSGAAQHRDARAARLAAGRRAR